MDNPFKPKEVKLVNYNSIKYENNKINNIIDNKIKSSNVSNEINNSNNSNKIDAIKTRIDALNRMKKWK